MKRISNVVLIAILAILALPVYILVASVAWRLGFQDVHVSQIEEGPHGCWEIDAETDMWRCP
jgi:hypothetical protein